MKSFHFVIRHLLYAILLISNLSICVRAQDLADARSLENTSQISTINKSLNNLNQEFRKLYYEQTKTVMDELPLILIIGGDNVTTLTDQSRTVYPLSSMLTPIEN